MEPQKLKETGKFSDEFSAKPKFDLIKIGLIALIILLIIFLIWSFIKT